MKIGSKPVRPTAHNVITKVFLLGPTGIGKTYAQERYIQGPGADLSCIKSTPPSGSPFEMKTTELSEPEFGGQVNFAGYDAKLSIIDSVGQDPLSRSGGEGFGGYNAQKLGFLNLYTSPIFFCAANDKNSLQKVIPDWVSPLYDGLISKGELKVIGLNITKAKINDSEVSLEQVIDGEYMTLDDLGLTGSGGLIEQMKDKTGVYPLTYVSDQVVGDNNQAEVYLIGPDEEGKLLDKPLKLSYRGVFGLTGLLLLRDVKFPESEFDITNIDKYSLNVLDKLKTLNVR